MASKYVASLPHEIALDSCGRATNLPRDFSGICTNIRLESGFRRINEYGSFFLHNECLWHYDARDSISVKKIETGEKCIALVRHGASAFMLCEENVYWLKTGRGFGYRLSCLGPRKSVKYFVSDGCVFYFEESPGHGTDKFMCKLAPNPGKTDSCNYSMLSLIGDPDYVVVGEDDCDIPEHMSGRRYEVGEYRTNSEYTICKIPIPENMHRIEESVEGIVYENRTSRGSLLLKDGRSASIDFGETSGIGEFSLQEAEHNGRLEESLLPLVIRRYYRPSIEL